MITRVIDKFDGKLTRQSNGDLDSGLAKYSVTYGNDPFSNPGALTWLEAPTQIDVAGSVITDLIMAQKARLESGITYVYAVGHLGRVYKIQVNDPTTYNPNYDNPVLLTTLTVSSPTFKYGASIQFAGVTEQLQIGHDVGVTKLNFDGTGEAIIGSAGSYTANVPRPSTSFNGKTYWGNGTNLVEIDSTPTVLSYAKFTTPLPIGTFVRDLDVSPDGNYVQITVSRVAPQNMVVATQDTNSLSSGDSYLLGWNGGDVVPTTFNPYNSYSINSNTSFGSHQFTMGYDLGGATIYNKAGTKEVSLPNSLSPAFSSTFSTGNLLGFMSPETASSKLQTNLMLYGAYDREYTVGLYRLLRASATSPETDVVQIPSCLIVSNLFYGSSSAGYSGNQVGSAKIYYSTLETSSAPTTKYRFYKFTTVPTGLGTAIGGVYETQTELAFRLFRSILSSSFKVQEVRVYASPLVANNSFTIAFTGLDGSVITNSSQTFTVGSNASAGDTLVKYNPAMSPSAALGLRITNLGTKNWTGQKVEIDVEQWGK